MKNLLIIAFSVLAAIWIPSVSADQSPESVVSCLILGPGTYRVMGLSLPASINAETCEQSKSDINLACASCITSLESQGCKTLDVVTGKTGDTPTVTYFLSCLKP
jgi:hypothetical protein